MTSQNDGFLQPPFLQSSIHVVSLCLRGAGSLAVLIISSNGAESRLGFISYL